MANQVRDFVTFIFHGAALMTCVLGTSVQVPLYRLSTAAQLATERYDRDVSRLLPLLLPIFRPIQSFNIEAALLGAFFVPVSFMLVQSPPVLLYLPSVAMSWEGPRAGHD
jgi:hypothetical protein